MDINGNIAGPLIRKARRTQKLTQNALAERMKEAGFPITHRTISAIECGRRCVWSHELAAFARALSVSPVALLQDL